MKLPVASYNNSEIARDSKTGIIDFHKYMERSHSRNYSVSQELFEHFKQILETDGGQVLEESLISWASNIYYSIVAHVQSIKEIERKKNCPHIQWKTKRYEDSYHWDLEIDQNSEEFEYEDQGIDYTYPLWYPVKYREWLLENPEPEPLPRWKP